VQALPELDRIERKLRRLRRIEASYRSEIRRALEASKMDTLDPVKAKERFERIRTKVERRIDRLVPKIRTLTVRRAELKARKG